MKTQNLKLAAALGWFLFFVFVGNPLATAATLRTVAFSGTLAPGTPEGVLFSSFGRPALNNAGQTAFVGSLTGTEVDRAFDSGIWSEGGGSGLALVAREGNEAPGTPEGVHFRSLTTRLALLNNAGQTTFLGYLTGIGVVGANSIGIWSEGGGGGLALVARSGNAAPGTPNGVNFSVLGRPALNNAGQTAFRGSLTVTGVDRADVTGIWSEGSGSGLALVARSGNAAPGTPEGILFRSFSSTPALNNAGQTAFRGSLTGIGGVSANSTGIWSEGGGSGLALVARSGNEAPGTPEGVLFSRFAPPTLNNAGQTVFKGVLTGPEVDETNNRGIWSERGGSGLALVARSGNEAPGTPEGVLFSRFGTSGIKFDIPALNNAGQTAFVGRLTGPGVDVTNNRGIWAEDQQGVLTLIAREGDLLDVDDGLGTDFRTISSLSFDVGLGRGGGHMSGFNDLGQIAFGAVFTDGTRGVFVSNLAAVPEPAGWVLAVAGLLSLGATRRR